MARRARSYIPKIMVGDIIQSKRFEYGCKPIENDFTFSRTYCKGDIVINGKSRIQHVFRTVSTSDPNEEIIKKARREGWSVREEMWETQEGSLGEFLGRTHEKVYVVDEKVDITCHDKARAEKLYVVESVKENSNEFYSLGVSSLIEGKYWNPNPKETIWIRVSLGASKEGVQRSKIENKGYVPFEKVCREEVIRHRVYARGL